MSIKNLAFLGLIFSQWLLLSAGTYHPIKVLVIGYNPGNFIAKSVVYNRAVKKWKIDPAQIPVIYYDYLRDSFSKDSTVLYQFLTAEEQDDFLKISRYAKKDDLLSIVIDAHNINAWNELIDKYRPDYFVLINRYEVLSDLVDKLTIHEADIEIIGNRKIQHFLFRARGSVMVNKERAELKLGFVQQEIIKQISTNILDLSAK